MHRACLSIPSILSDRWIHSLRFAYSSQSNTTPSRRLSFDFRERSPSIAEHQRSCESIYQGQPDSGFNLQEASREKYLDAFNLAWRYSVRQSRQNKPGFIGVYHRLIVSLRRLGLFEPDEADLHAADWRESPRVPLSVGDPNADESYWFDEHAPALWQGG